MCQANDGTSFSCYCTATATNTTFNNNNKLKRVNEYSIAAIIYIDSIDTIITSIRIILKIIQSYNAVEYKCNLISKSSIWKRNSNCLVYN